VYNSDYNVRRDSAVAVATGYVLDDRGVGVRVTVRVVFLSSLHVVQTYLGGGGALSPISSRYRGRFAFGSGHEADHTSPTITVAKNTWIDTSASTYDLDTFTFLLIIMRVIAKIV
jgi:hypothetical protein